MKLKPMDENTLAYTRKRIIRYRKAPNPRNTIMMSNLMMRSCIRIYWNRANYDDLVDEFERLIMEAIKAYELTHPK